MFPAGPTYPSLTAVCCYLSMTYKGATSGVPISHLAGTSDLPVKPDRWTDPACSNSAVVVRLNRKSVTVCYITSTKTVYLSNHTAEFACLSVSRLWSPAWPSSTSSGKHTKSRGNPHTMDTTWMFNSPASSPWISEGPHLVILNPSHSLWAKSNWNITETKQRMNSKF